MKMFSRQVSGAKNRNVLVFCHWPRRRCDRSVAACERSLYQCQSINKVNDKIVIMWNSSSYKRHNIVSSWAKDATIDGYAITLSSLSLCVILRNASANYGWQRGQTDGHNIQECTFPFDVLKKTAITTNNNNYSTTDLMWSYEVKAIVK